MKFVMEAIRKQELEEKRPVIRLEIDYELATLHDALILNDRVQIIKSKERLELLRRQWLGMNET
ncbi:hypothetical protein [Lentibacillus saliphilus]|uniref:hypothetical protein n=1 Tax=Lentibacillus saliphilus TaxID=2737028 RepID=UPI001C300808|nr:hypothetical protein [Lentibacillus saliphilus]